jgi:cytochrome c oxidase subunit 4
MSWGPPRIVLIAWVALLALLGTTIFLAYQPLGNFFLAYQPLGNFNLVIALCIAMAKTLIIMAVFMELRERSGLMIAFAAAGFFWLSILVWLSGTDFVTRPQFPPHL